MLLQHPKDCSIIEVNFQKIIYIFFERCNYNSGKDGRSILQTKRHHCVLGRAPFCSKCCLMSIFWRNYDLMVTRKAICERIDLLSSYIVQYFVCKWCREGVMQTCIIQFSQVHTNSDFPFCLLFLNHHGTYPFRLFDRFDDPSR